MFNDGSLLIVYFQFIQAQGPVKCLKKFYGPLSYVGLFFKPLWYYQHLGHTVPFIT
jgi:hypothetical protein